MGNVTTSSLDELARAVVVAVGEGDPTALRRALELAEAVLAASVETLAADRATLRG